MDFQIMAIVLSSYIPFLQGFLEYRVISNLFHIGIHLLSLAHNEEHTIYVLFVSVLEGVTVLTYFEIYLKSHMRSLLHSFCVLFCFSKLVMCFTL